MVSTENSSLAVGKYRISMPKRKENIILKYTVVKLRDSIQVKSKAGNFGSKERRYNLKIKMSRVCYPGRVQGGGRVLSLTFELRCTLFLPQLDGKGNLRNNNAFYFAI